MEETAPPGDITVDFDRRLAPLAASRREEARQYVAERQRRLGELEAALAHRIGHVGHQLHLARQAASDTETELAESRGELEAAAKKLRLDERGLAQLRRECEANAEELAYHRQRLHQRVAELDLEREQLAELRAETKCQRWRVANQLKNQREEHRRVVERERAELDRRQAEVGEAEALARQLDEARRRLAQAAEQLPAADGPSPAPDDDANQALADMTRRYELAMDDLREQKRLVAEAEQRNVAVPRGATPADGGGRLDWEAQKQRMLAALEASQDDEDAEHDEGDDRRAERLQIRDVLARTNEAIAAKDGEIEELKQLLAAQATSIGDVAVGAAAFAEVLSADEVVRTERERLQQLQREWEDKLRQAEIDLSLQRARIARERAEIEERQRSWQHQQAAHPAADHDVSKSAKPQRGRWLARLGLKEDET